MVRPAAVVVLAIALASGCKNSSSQPAASNQASQDADAKIRASLTGAQRTDEEKARDIYRHPLETLEFFGLHDDMTVVELAPGTGWFTAVLAPVLAERGKLRIAGGDPNGPPDKESTKNARELADRMGKGAASFGKVETLVVNWRNPDLSFGPDGSADMVLTFRNAHNWLAAGIADKVLASVHKVLKPGGILGLTDHRAKPDAPTDAKTFEDTGYVPEAYLVKVVEAAGFKLAAKSEINANPKDTKDYPKGVWTLPPTYELKDVDHAKYEAIGESDRMTLKFVKL